MVSQLDRERPAPWPHDRWSENPWNATRSERRLHRRHPARGDRPGAGAAGRSQRRGSSHRGSPPPTTFSPLRTARIEAVALTDVPPGDGRRHDTVAARDTRASRRLNRPHVIEEGDEQGAAGPPTRGRRASAHQADRRCQRLRAAYRTPLISRPPRGCGSQARRPGSPAGRRGAGASGFRRCPLTSTAARPAGPGR